MNGRPNTLAEVAERRQAGEDFGRLLSEFLDQFYPALASGGAQAMIAMEPATLADVRAHALLGAAGEHLARGRAEGAADRGKPLGVPPAVDLYRSRTVPARENAARLRDHRHGLG